MKTKILSISIAVLLALSLAGCGGMNKRTTGTLVGAGVGALAGQALTGSPYGLIGGAVVGGVVGNQVTR